MSGKKGAYLTKIRMSSNGGRNCRLNTQKKSLYNHQRTVDSDKDRQWVVKLLSECFKKHNLKISSHRLFTH